MHLRLTPLATDFFRLPILRAHDRFVPTAIIIIKLLRIELLLRLLILTPNRIWEDQGAGVNNRGVVAALLRSRDLLAAAGNNFRLSSWRNADEAAAEIDEFVRQVQAGVVDLTRLRQLFGPFGPIHQVALMNDWVEEFLEIAARFDEAIFE